LSRGPTGERPTFGRRALGGLVDLAALALLAFGLRSFSPTALPVLPVLVAWLVCRPLPLVAYGATLGHALLRYRIVRQDGARPSWQGALQRDPALVASVAIVGWQWLSSAFPGASPVDPPSDDRYLHDRIADTWPVLADHVQAPPSA
jgi:uncharacterized RDD family membrane protein YckC